MNLRAFSAKLLLGTLTNEKPFHPDSIVFPEQLSTQDRAFVMALCLGTLRQAPRLIQITEHLLHKPLKKKDADIWILLLLGLYQLLEMNTPEHAAIFETAQAAKSLKKPWACGLINANLRRWQVDSNEIKRKFDRSAQYLSAHPVWLYKYIRQAWPERAETIFSENNRQPPIHLRINQQKISTEDYLTLLEKAEINAHKHPYSPVGITLETRVSVEKLPGFLEGFFSVQDIAAQQAAMLLSPQPNEEIWDLCAAPGGKAAHLLEHCPEIALTAVDIEAYRLERCAQNFKRLQLNSANLVAADAIHWLSEQKVEADAILIDAPCSGTGVIRRHPDIKILRTETQIKALCKTQYALLEAAWLKLAPGGRLLYATCSLLPQENQSQIEHFLNETADARLQPLDHLSWGTWTGFGLQVFPGEAQMDGFFYALLEKNTK